MPLPVLPQDETNPAARTASLLLAQEAYQYDYDKLAPLAALADLPLAEHFDTRYSVLQFETMSDVAANMAAVEVHEDLDPFDDLQSYAEFYPVLPKPFAATGPADDPGFARQRVAGVNPMVLARVRDAVDLIPLGLSADQLKLVTGLSTVSDAVAEGRLFVADYRMFSTVAAGVHGSRPKWLAPAIAVFASRSPGAANGMALAPLAIRLTPDSKTVTPQDGVVWEVAKMHVQVADANHHEMSTHLGRTHMVIEPFAIATARHLAANHPLRLLLNPHLRFDLAINAFALQTLIKPGGAVDRLLAGTLASSLKVATSAAASWDFEKFKLPNEVAARGVDDPEILPDYPYRDDGLLLWDAIGVFVKEYVGLYYPSPAMVAGDSELRAWLQELGSSNGGRVIGLPEALTGPDDLAAVLQQVIFTSGPQHSAINFPQWDFLGAPANMPLAAYASPAAPPVPDQSAEQALLQVLPPAEQVRGQIEIMRFLSGWHYDRLGQYPPGAFLDPRAQAAVARFQQALGAAENTINDRNARRIAPYPYLLPSNVLNSSNL